MNARMRVLLLGLLASCAWLPRCNAASGQSPSCLLESSSAWGPDGAVLTIATGESAEGGLLGIAVHPQDATQLFVYVTVPGPENQLQRWKLAGDHGSATLDKVLIAGIAAGTFHDGGRTDSARTACSTSAPAMPAIRISRRIPRAETASSCAS
jgi:hypothetical protein